MARKPRQLKVSAEGI